MCECLCCFLHNVIFIEFPCLHRRRFVVMGFNVFFFCVFVMFCYFTSKCDECGQSWMAKHNDANPNTPSQRQCFVCYVSNGDEIGTRVAVPLVEKRRCRVSTQSPPSLHTNPKIRISAVFMALEKCSSFAKESCEHRKEIVQVYTCTRNFKLENQNYYRFRRRWALTLFHDCRSRHIHTNTKYDYFFC